MTIGFEEAKALQPGTMIVLPSGERYRVGEMTFDDARGSFRIELQHDGDNRGLDTFFTEAHLQLITVESVAAPEALTEPEAPVEPTVTEPPAQDAEPVDAATAEPVQDAPTDPAAGEQTSKKAKK